MIQRVTSADESQSETFLLLGGFEGLGANCNGGCCSCGLLIVHDGLIPGVNRVLHFLYREEASAVNGV